MATDFKFSGETPEFRRQLEAYQKLLDSGELIQFGSEYVIIHNGRVAAHGHNEAELLSNYLGQNPDADGKIYIGRADGVEEAEFSTPEFETEV